jgi:diguanylate cyclase (GGDEF)-like protein/PAS domain S-box-containing protein
VTGSAAIEVLLVEDNPGDARLVEIMLSEADPAGFEVAHVGCLREALERLNGSPDGSAYDGRYDVVLLDLSLPDSRGLETVERVRLAAPLTPVVILSGQDDEETALQALKSGAQDYLVKGRGDGELVARSIRYSIERKRVEEALRRSEGRFRLLVENAADAFFVHDIEGRFVDVNQRACDSLGYTREELLALSVQEVERTLVPGVLEKQWEQLLSGAHMTVSGVHRRKDGTTFPVEARLALFETGGRQLTLALVRDFTERQRAEERMAYLAQYDHLTGLANRTLLQDRLHQALARGERDGAKVALLFLDLDHFKAVNDTFGHAAGDELLQAVAGRLKGRLRESDTVARLGGDEFAVVLENMGDGQDAGSVAQDILDILSEPLALSGREIPVAASIGIAVCPPSGGESLLKDADAAMYRAKQQGRGRNTYEFYTEEMNVQAAERMALVGSLRQALERGEFLLHYQPQVELVAGRIVGAEALLRWRHPERGIVSPGEFVPVLEETGLIEEVGEWVLQTACAQSRAWKDAGLPPVRMAVNLSARQFRRGDLAGSVVRTLLRNGLERGCLELEITESLLMDDSEASSAMLEELKTKNGFRIAIDDFGTGYSSLDRLKSIPVDLLKIDRSFVRDIANGSKDAAIVAAVIDLAHHLGLEVIGEGVETEEQLDFLLRHGCDEVQGFYFSKPVPADEFAEMLAGMDPTPPDVPA